MTTEEKDQNEITKKNTTVNNEDPNEEDQQIVLQTYNNYSIGNNKRVINDELTQSSHLLLIPRIISEADLYKNFYT